VTAPVRRAPRLLVALAVVFVLVVATTGAFSLIAQGFRSTTDFTRTLTAQADKLTVHNDRGDVLLLPSRDGLVHVFAESQHGISEPQVDAESTARGVTLDGSCDSDLAIECTVDFTVQVPASFDVDVTVGAGSVTASDLAGQIWVGHLSGDVRLDDLSGPVSVTGDEGRVEANGLRSATVDVSNGSGDVQVEMAAVPTSMRVYSEQGDVQIAVPGTEEYRIEAAAAGSTQIGVADDAMAPHSIRATSRSGDVVIWPALRGGPRIKPIKPIPPFPPGAPDAPERVFPAPVPVFPDGEDGPG
jgi:hypothetical protein